MRLRVAISSSWRSASKSAFLSLSALFQLVNAVPSAVRAFFRTQAATETSPALGTLSGSLVDAAQR